MPLSQLGGLSRMRSAAAPTARAEFERLLRNKSAWLQDVSKHPLCAGVPLGRNGGPEQAISMDIGAKNLARVSTRELAASSSQYKQQLIRCTKGIVGTRTTTNQLENVWMAKPIPMAVIVKEDVQRLPVVMPARCPAPSVPLDSLMPHSSPHFCRCTRPNPLAFLTKTSNLNKTSKQAKTFDLTST